MSACLASLKKLTVALTTLLPFSAIANRKQTQPAPSEQQPKEPQAMSILTDVIKKKITIDQGISEAVQYGEKILAGDPTLTALATSVVDGAKTALVKAAVIADSDIQPFVAPAAQSVADAAETMLAGMTGGVSNFANPAITYAINDAANALKAEIDNAVAKLQASVQPANGVILTKPLS